MIGIASLFMAGCSGFLSGKSNLPQPRELNPALIEQANSGVIWSSKTNSKTSLRSGLRFHLAESDGALFVAGENGAVTALDLSSGAIRWSRSVGKLYAGVGAANGVLLVGTEQGELVALSAGDGSELWRKEVLGSAATAPIATPSLAIVRTLSGAVEAFDLLTGEERWAYIVARPEMGTRGGAQPMVFDGKLLLPNDIGQLGLLDLEDGKIIWGVNLGKMQDGSLMGQLRDIDAAPIQMGDRIYAATTTNGVTALTTNGRLLWQAGSGVHAGIAADHETIYAVELDSRLRALASRNGEEVWVNNDLIGRWLTEPQLLGTTLVVGDYEGYLHYINSTTGALIKSSRVSSQGFLPDTLLINNTMILMDRAGGIYRIGL